jgi:hypothetical protein
MNSYAIWRDKYMRQIIPKEIGELLLNCVKETLRESRIGTGRYSEDVHRCIASDLTLSSEQVSRYFSCQMQLYIFSSN